MEFPFGHHHHHHHGPEPTEEGRYPPPPHNPYPPPPHNTYPPPQHNPYPPPTHNPYPPPSHNPYGYQPPPPPSNMYADGAYGSRDYVLPPPVHHVSHEVGPDEYGRGYGHEHHEHHHQHHVPGFGPSHVEHVSHEGKIGEVARQRTVRVYTKAKEDYSLSIREGSVVLVPSNPRDEYQHWIKDLRYSTKVKDQEGLPSFALVNKVTGQAIKHAIGATHPVRLVPYNPDYLDQSLLWTESKDTGEGFRCIRMVNNIRMNFDAFHGDEDHGGVHDGTTVVLWEWLKGKNQRWKIVPY